MPRRPVLIGAVALVLVGDLARIALRSDHPTTPAPSVTGPARAAPPGLPTDPDVSGDVQPPAPGLYRYIESTVRRPDTFEWGMRVVAHPTQPRSFDIQTTSPGTRQTVEFTPSAELQVAFSQIGTTVADEVTCAGAPPVVLLKLPLRPNMAWSTGSRCGNLLGDRLLDTERLKVVGRSTQVIAGWSVPVWEIVAVSTHVSTPAHGGPSTSSTTTTTMDISARLGLTVRRVVQDGNNPATTRTDRLVALQPV